ncbi:MAG: hypothetical protein CMO81_02185 [Waddliaceae bacterium]|nr:hypothetical protein [Waddliaceae bacterium]
MDRDGSESHANHKELDLPETVFVRDIENRVFQGIVLQCLARIKGVSLLEGNLIDNILGRSSSEGVKGIHAEQDCKTHSISVRIEVNICYGLSIPEKAAEIQDIVVADLSKLTGLHVHSVHVIFKNLILADPTSTLINSTGPEELEGDVVDEEYTDEF